MSELTDALVVAIESLEIHDTDDAALAAWMLAVREQLEALHRHLDAPDCPALHSVPRG